MPTPLPNFCGPTYQLTNQYAAIERCINWYPIANESGAEAESKLSLEQPPCNAAFGTLPVPAPFNQSCRGLLENRGSVYGVNGTIAFVIDSTGTYTKVGTVVSDGRPCSIVANGTGQVFIASAGYGYVIQASPPPFVMVSADHDRSVSRGILRDISRRVHHRSHAEFEPDPDQRD